MNAILERVLAGEYEAGLERHARISAPSAEDDRFAGVCLFNLQRLHEARELLLRAQSRGCRAAGIELATVCRQLGQVELGREVLAEVERCELSPFDRALAMRERGAQAYTAAELTEATDALERAWMEAHRAPLGDKLLPAIGQALGLVYATRGLDRRATDYFRASLRGVNASREVYVRASRAQCLAYLGQLEEAERDLDLARTGLRCVPLAAPYVHYVAGIVAWVRGRLEQAARAFAEASRLACKAGEPETESHAHLGSCAVATGLGRLDEAQGHLARARATAVTAPMRSLALLREGALLARRRDARAAGALREAAARFAQQGLLREEGAAWIQVAEAELRDSRWERAAEALRCAAVARHAVGDGAPLAAELRLAPSVVRFLAGLEEGAYAKVLYRDLVRIAGAAPVRVELRTLGGSELLTDGRHTRLDLRRSLEVLAYLLAHPDSTLARVLVDLFGDDKPEQARGYFHQVRYELARAVPGLSVPFDPRSRTYRVCCEGLELTWDVAEMKRALERGGEEGVREALRWCQGTLLPDADSEWVRNEREELTWLLVNVGLEALSELYVQGRYDACLSMAGSLLEVEPYDEALNEVLVNAAFALQGTVPAQRLAARLAQRFQRELGVIPPALERLRGLN